MLFEDILLALAASVAIFMIGLPTYKLFRLLSPPKRDPVAEAKERLEKARLEAEAARLEKETEKVYHDLYQDVLEDDSDSEKHNRRL